MSKRGISRVESILFGLLPSALESLDDMNYFATCYQLRPSDASDDWHLQIEQEQSPLQQARQFLDIVNARLLAGIRDGIHEQLARFLNDREKDDFDPSDQCEILLRSGTTLNFFGLDSFAYRCGLAAMRCAQHYKLTQWDALTFEASAIRLQRAYRSSEATQALKTAVSLHVASGDRLGQFASSLRLARYQRLSGDFESAGETLALIEKLWHHDIFNRGFKAWCREKCLLEALNGFDGDLYHTLGLAESKPSELGIMPSDELFSAESYLLLRNFTRARESFERLIPMVSSYSDDATMAEIHVGMAQATIGEKNYDWAEQSLLAAIRLTGTATEYRLATFFRATELLATVWTSKDRRDKASRLLQLLTSLRGCQLPTLGELEPLASPWSSALAAVNSDLEQSTISNGDREWFEAPGLRVNFRTRQVFKNGQESTNLTPPQITVLKLLVSEDFRPKTNFEIVCALFPNGKWTRDNAPKTGHNFRVSLNKALYPFIEVHGHRNRGYWIEFPPSS